MNRPAGKGDDDERCKKDLVLDRSIRSIRKKWSGSSTASPPRAGSSRARAGSPSVTAAASRTSTATVCSTSTSPATGRGTTMCAALPSWALSWSWTSGAFSSCADGTTARRSSYSPTSTRGSRARSAIFGRAACSRRFGWPAGGRAAPGGGVVRVHPRICRGPYGGERDRPSTLVGGGHPYGRSSRSAVAYHGRRLSPAGVPLREAAPQAAAGAAYRRIKEARLPRAAFLYAIFTG